MPLLEYDKEHRVFSFVRPEGCLPFPGAAISMDPGGRRFSFEDVSPKNYFNVQSFKAFYPNEAKATKAAAERVAEMRVERETDFCAKYADLISGTPYKHQLATIDLMQKNDRYALLLEQGLGKTYIALQAFKMFKARDGFLRAVVVCPKVVFQTWLHEVSKFSPELKVLQYRGNLEERRELYAGTPDFDILLTTYDMIRPRGDRSMASYNGWAWEVFDRPSRERLVQAIPLDEKKRKTLLSDESAMCRTARAKWRITCGKILSPIGGGWWNNRPFLTYDGSPAWKSVLYHMGERVRFCHLVQAEARNDRPVDFINDLRPNVIVFDEASRLVSPNSKQSEAATEMVSRRKYLLSGTLCVGRPTDMFMPMKVLDKTIIDMSWTKFRDKFCYTSRFNRHIITGYRNLDQLKRKVDPFIVEYKRDECLDLPDRTIISCYYEPDPRVVELYDEVVASDKVEVNGKTIFCPMQLQKIQKCMQLLSGFVNTANEYRYCSGCEEDTIFSCAMQGIYPGGAMCARRGEIEAQGDTGVTVEIVEPKHNAKLEMLRNDLEQIVRSEKAIIWYWYTYDYVQILSLLDDMNISYITATDDDCASRFEADKDCRVFVGQITQGIGITLNSATTTIYYSHGLALEPRLQSMDRNLRIGQSKPVVVRDYVCRGSIEEAVVDLLQHKEDVKDFMQRRVECIACDSMHRCLENGVRRYGEGCVHYGNMKKAEEKHTLRLCTLGGVHEQ